MKNEELRMKNVGYSFFQDLANKGNPHSSFFILHSSFEDSSFEDSSSVETLNPISDDDDDYSKKNRPLPVRSKRGVSIFYLYIYNIIILYIYK